MDEKPIRWLIFKWDAEGEPVGLCTVEAPTTERALLEAGKYTFGEFDLNACPLDGDVPVSDLTRREAEENDRANGR